MLDQLSGQLRRDVMLHAVVVPVHDLVEIFQRRFFVLKQLRERFFPAVQLEKKGRKIVVDYRKKTAESISEAIRCLFVYSTRYLNHYYISDRLLCYGRPGV